jgi:hypothetical protein
LQAVDCIRPKDWLAADVDHHHVDQAHQAVEHLTTFLTHDVDYACAYHAGLEAKQGADQWVVHRFNGVELDHLAPKRARKAVECGPAITLVKSRMRKPSSQPASLIGCTTSPTGYDRQVERRDVTKSLGQRFGKRSCAAVGDHLLDVRSSSQVNGLVVHQAVLGR